MNQLRLKCFPLRLQERRSHLIQVNEIGHCIYLCSVAHKILYAVCAGYNSSYDSLYLYSAKSDNYIYLLHCFVFINFNANSDLLSNFAEFYFGTSYINLYLSTIYMHLPPSSSSDTAGLLQPLPVSSVQLLAGLNSVQERHSLGMAEVLQMSSSTTPVHYLNNLHTLELL